MMNGEALYLPALNTSSSAGATAHIAMKRYGEWMSALILSPIILAEINYRTRSSRQKVERQKRERFRSIQTSTNELRRKNTFGIFLLFMPAGGRPHVDGRRGAICETRQNYALNARSILIPVLFSIRMCISLRVLSLSSTLLSFSLVKSTNGADEYFTRSHYCA